MTRRMHTLAPFFIAAACIVGSAGAQGQPPPRGIVKIAGELYRAQNDNHFVLTRCVRCWRSISTTPPRAMR